MILILSENFDQSTNEVIDWLIHLKQKYIRLNSGDLDITNAILRDDTEIGISFKERFFSVDALKSIWYRRGDFAYPKTVDLDIANEIEAKILNHLEKEWQALLDYFFSYLRKKRYLGIYLKDEPSKLFMLHCAKSVGLLIPDTIVTTSKKEVLAFAKKFKSGLITKGIQNTPSITFKNRSIDSYTELLDGSVMNSLQDSFFPTLFQEAIQKEVDIRVFALDGNFYSMAIFSQESAQTKTDFRRYDQQNPNRTVPYILPSSIKKKLSFLMKKLKLNTCSFDIVLSADGKHYFLEINPAGQFMMVSKPCNYYLEKKIARVLSK